MGLFSWKKKVEQENDPKEVSPHEFSTDRAITSLEQDELGRAQYARSLADAIIRWEERDSLVLGVCGDWGSGKTSLKNMILDALSEKKFEHILVDFNPWEWSCQQQVSSAFFHELVANLKKRDADPKLVKRLELYVEVAQLGQDLVDRFQKWVDRYLVLTIAAFGVSWLKVDTAKEAL